MKKEASKKKFVYITIILIVIALAAVFIFKNNEPLRIGVLLPLTGPDAVDSNEVLDWAAEHINSQGGINGKEIEVVYKDTYQKDIKQLAKEFLDDKSIKIVIGPGTSAEVYEIAPMFIENKKILISPMATSGDIFRAFGKKEFFWRTVQGDQAQIRVILDMLHEREVKKVALLSEDTVYGKTFYDWAGFFAIESGIDLVYINNFRPGMEDFSKIVEEAVKDNPEYLICAAFPEDAAKIKKETDKLNSKTKLMFTDAAESAYLIEQFGEKSEGLELVTPTANPESGFNEKYKKDFGYYPWDYSAFTYDAFLLSVYSLARQEYSNKWFMPFGKESLKDSFKKIVYGKGEKVRWDESAKAIKLILKGEIPDVEGASGTLEFDKDEGIDVLETYYSLNRIETREDFRDFYAIKTVSSDESKEHGRLEEGDSAYQTRASEELSKLAEDIKAQELAERKDLWAVIIATSKDWKNYRHQSDALAFYDILKDNGLDDDHIILLTIDDIPWLPQNKLKGDIHHKINGENLREDAILDYSSDKVSLQNFKNILLGIKTEETPIVLESTENSNVIIYIVDHGAPGFIPFEHGGLLTSEDLAKTVEEMNLKKKFRQMFIMVEVCFGESIGLDIKTPNVVYFTGASKTETSFGATYDSNIRQWIADDFSNHAFNKIRENPEITIEELYMQVYQKVFGSHVRLVNYENFGDLRTPMKEFIRP